MANVPPTVPINPASSVRELLVQLLLLVDAGFTDFRERLDTMQQAIQSETAAEATLSAKVDLLLAAFAAGKQQVADLQAQIAALQAQVAAGGLGADDTAALSTALADMQAKAAAIDTALTPPTAPTAPTTAVRP